MRCINGIPRWLYRLRFIIAGVRILHRYGWRTWFAWRSVANDFDNGGDAQHDGYTPEDSVRESLSYWG